MEADLKGATGIDTSSLASKTDLASLKSKWDNLDVDKFKTVSADLSKLNNVDNDVKKVVYCKLVIEVNALDTKMPSTSGLVTKTWFRQTKSSEED